MCVGAHRARKGTRFPDVDSPTVISILTLVLGNELGSLEEQQELLLLSHLSGLSNYFLLIGT